MTPFIKPDADQIKEHLQSLKNQSWMDSSRKWWPNYIFRFDHIESTADIINSGKILSRAAAKEAGLLKRDSASPNVLGTTSDRWKSYVRLYFRPRTPTQYDSEGFRPSSMYTLNAHCPVPVIMLFDSTSVLTRQDTCFSNGNLAANRVETGSTAEFFKNLPFEKIYNNTSLAEEEKRTIIFHRNAEVIIPKEMDISSLRHIVCRTQAEYETLLYLLEPQAREKWSTIIGLGTGKTLHYSHWTFIEQVDLSSEQISMKFNASTIMPGPFNICIEIHEDQTGKDYEWTNESRPFYSNKLDNSTLVLTLQPLKHPDSYTIKVTLDNCLAYINHYSENNVPF